MSFFQNPWFIGIAGGVLSGLLVAFITRWLFSKRDRKEYAQKLRIANSEVLYAIRPGISEGHIPDQSILGSLIEATARKYSVDREDMYSSNDISNELIKEVMDSSFISATAKDEFCKKLSAFKVALEQPAEDKPDVLREYEMMSKYRRQAVAMMGVITGTMTAVMGIFAAMKMTDGALFDSRNLLFLALPALITVLAAFAFRIVRDLNDMRAKSMEIRFLGTRFDFERTKDDKTDPNKD